MDYDLDRGVLGFWTEKEKKLAGAHLLDLCHEALRKGKPVQTPFLDQALGDWLEGILRRQGLTYRAVGGFPDAERTRFLVGEDAGVLAKAAVEIRVLRVIPGAGWNIGRS